MIMFILNTKNVFIKMAMKDLREFTFKNYHKQLGFIKEDSYYALQKQRKK